MLAAHRSKAPEEAAKALIGLQKIQSISAARAAKLPDAVAQIGRATLHDYGGSGDAVVFVPSLINPANILDLTPQRALLPWLATQGFHPYLVNWGDVAPEDHDLSISDHIRSILVPLLQTLTPPAHLVGYCLGGTMALAAAQLTEVQSLTLIAAPWRYAAYPADSRAAMADIWAAAKSTANDMGVLPMEVLQTMFWQLDPQGTIGKYARFAGLLPHTPEHDLFLAMEQWANGGAPLPFAAARELFEDFIANDKPGQGEWQIASQSIKPQNIRCRTLEIVSLTDRIAPAATATQHFERLEIARGHVGMITGSQAKQRLWVPLREWLSQSA